MMPEENIFAREVDEKEKIKQTIEYTGPLSYNDQPEVLSVLRHDYTEAAWQDKLEFLYNKLHEIFKRNDVHIITSSYRIKGSEGILRKITAMQKDNVAIPVIDIFGTRFILDDESAIQQATALIKKAFPAPDVFPWGVPTHRVGPYKKGSHPDYQSTRLNFPFVSADSEFQSIGEVQLLTPDQEKTEKATREYYEAQRSKL